nr:cation transporter [Streptomyces canus]
MTCASRAARIEKKLNRMDGVTATVNFATEKAKVAHPAGSRSPSPSPPLRNPVYTAEEPAPLALQAGEKGGGRAAAPAADRSALPAPAAARLARTFCTPALQFDNWQWLSPTPAPPVIAWGAFPFHKAAWRTPGTAPRRRTRWRSVARSP